MPVLTLAQRVSIASSTPAGANDASTSSSYAVVLARVIVPIGSL
jgi:hypothetical protein